MAPKKAATKGDEKKKEEKKEVPPELKELREKEKALVRVPQPDRAELDAAQQSISTAIEELQGKLQEVNRRIGERSQGKEEHHRCKDEIRAKLDEYQQKIDALEKKRQELHGGINAKQQEGRDKRQELNSIKKKLGYDTAEDVDKRIEELEYKLQTESMSLKKEKELMGDIKELRRTRPQVQKYSTMDASTDQEGITGMRAGLGDLKEQLAELRDAKKLQSQALGKLVEARQKVMQDVPELFEKREALNSEVRAKIAARNELRDAFYAKQKEYNVFLGEQRALRAERARIERGARQAEWEARSKDRAAEEGTDEPVVPFLEELTYLDNMIKHLTSLKPKDESTKENAHEGNKQNLASAGGETVLLSKGDRDQEYFFAPTKKKNLKKGGSKAKAKALVHSMETLTFFDKFKVVPPADVNAVERTIETVNEKVAEFKAKQAKAVEDAKKKPAPKAAEPAESAEPAEPAVEVGA